MHMALTEAVEAVAKRRNSVMSSSRDMTSVKLSELVYMKADLAVNKPHQSH